jgi:hypothetical protein
MKLERFWSPIVMSAALAACTPTSTSTSTADAGPLPGYLVRMEKMEEHSDRTSDRSQIVKSPREDVEVLRGYPRFPNKGAIMGPAGERLTIMTRRTAYAVGEEIRVLHVHEATRPGVSLMVMGPKGIFGEYVDARLASHGAEAPPEPYDGVTLPSPDVDHNYESSSYKLPAGKHTVQWKFKTLSGTYLESNVLTIEVR